MSDWSMAIIFAYSRSSQEAPWNDREPRAHPTRYTVEPGDGDIEGRATHGGVQGFDPVRVRRHRRDRLRPSPHPGFPDLRDSVCSLKEPSHIMRSVPPGLPSPNP